MANGRDRRYSYQPYDNPFVSGWNSYWDETDRYDERHRKNMQGLDDYISKNPYLTEDDIRRRFEMLPGRSGRAGEKNLDEYMDANQRLSRSSLAESARSLRKQGVTATNLREMLKDISGLSLIHI